MVIERIRNAFGNLAITRYSRIENYIDGIYEKFALHNKRDEEMVAELDSLITSRLNSLKRLYTYATVLYILAYFGIVGYIFGDVYLISELAAVWKALIGVVGTTIFFIALFFVNRLKELYYEDLNLLTAHFISIYSRHELIEDQLFKDSNSYSSFIGFFKRRGF